MRRLSDEIAIALGLAIFALVWIAMEIVSAVLRGLGIKGKDDA